MAIPAPVLTYHRVLPDEVLSAPQPLTVPVSVFRSHLSTLRRLGYSSIGPREFAEALRTDKLPAGRKACLITFDDGTLDVFEHALPICLEVGFRPTLFAVAGRLGCPVDFGPPGRVMSEEDVREWHRHGGFVGSHTLTHRALTELEKGDVASELSDARRILEDIIGEPVTSLAYPRGRCSPEVVRAVEAAGYECAFTTRKGNRHSYEERFLLRRVKAGRGTSPLRLRYRLSPLYHLLYSIHES